VDNFVTPFCEEVGDRRRVVWVEAARFVVFRLTQARDGTVNNTRSFRTPNVVQRTWAPRRRDGTSERRPYTEIIEERGQQRSANSNWLYTSTPLKLNAGQLKTPKDQWTWITLAKKDDMAFSRNGTINFAVNHTQLVVFFHVPKRGFYATQQM
jgi:hypothetical protein